MSSTLLQLRTQARQRADMENSQFVSDSELTQYINDSYNELYDLLVSKFEDYFVKDPLAFTLAAGASTYDLPTDFYKLIGMDRSLGGGAYYTIHPFSFENRNNRSINQIYRGIYPLVEYRIVGSILRFTPDDQATGDYRMWYVPSYTALAADGDALPVQIDRWAIYIVVDAAIKCLQKEESDVSVLMAQKQALMARIEAMAANRDSGETQQVTDVQNYSYDDPLFYRGY